jgi:hypothetical protein
MITQNLHIIYARYPEFTPEIRVPVSDRQTISFIEISIEAGILLGGKHEACFVLGLAGIEPMQS